MLTDQTIWLSPGWQTLAFLPNGDAGARACQMAVQMSPLSRPWQSDARDARVVEALFAGISAGELDVAPSVLGLARTKFEINPMLAVTAQQLVRLGSAEHGESPELLDGLSNLLGYHPDIAAVRSPLLGRITRNRAEVPWPPMFDSSYRKFLLSAAQLCDNVIGEDSPAERIAPFLNNTGPWLRWDGTGEILSHQAQTTDPLAWCDPHWSWDSERRGSVPSAALRQIEDAIGDIADFRHVEGRDVVGTLGVARLAELLRMPKSPVR
ncbi:hypothetical protein [Mycobacterium sp. 360MFTsu5.1]|uniref:hypothetical protein n=1 Tax=Mycobacterium sp. 360MFTsu5.1 TaxID=1172186 RepID=UPI00036588DD|nr:hypothetical protein [Mycobacterium sp. 360MFTsu5.1]